VNTLNNLASRVLEHFVSFEQDNYLPQAARAKYMTSAVSHATCVVLIAKHDPINVPAVNTRACT
jgi:hypothetical protein